MSQDTKKYPVELKKQVVEMYLEGHSPTDLVKKFEIKNVRRVYEWAAKARKHGYGALDDKRGLNSTGRKKKEAQTLEEKYERLKLENEYLKKLLDLKRG